MNARIRRVVLAETDPYSASGADDGHHSIAADVFVGDPTPGPVVVYRSLRGAIGVGMCRTQMKSPGRSRGISFRSSTRRQTAPG